MVKCVVLAGSSESSKEIALISSTSEYVTNKAFLEINGKPMIRYIISALEESEYVKEIVVVGPVDSLNNCLSNFTGTVVEEHESGKVLDNVIKGIQKINATENILVVTSDIPLITSKAIDDFVRSCNNKFDLFYPVIPKEQNNLRFPGVERTYVNLIDGNFTGGNIFYLNPQKIRPCYESVDRLIGQRKNPFRLAMNFGVGFLTQFLLGKLSLNQAEQKISQILNIKVKVIVSTHPELGIDIDKISDLKLAQEIISDEACV
ncbi:nucleotidyltransferase family protein [Natranaerobius trueperi]|nr:nucleotidyltransferase family protein [Natranaerobius trueperi]